MRWRGTPAPGLRYDLHRADNHDEAGQSTSCHACGARVIGRDGYRFALISFAGAYDDLPMWAYYGSNCAGYVP